MKKAGCWGVVFGAQRVPLAAVVPVLRRSLGRCRHPQALPARAGEIPGKGQRPARQKQKLSPVTQNWWNIGSNFFPPLPLRLGSSAACQEAAVPVRLARLVEGCAAAAGTGSLRWGRAGAAGGGHGPGGSLPAPAYRRAGGSLPPPASHRAGGSLPPPESHRAVPHLP